jgi:glyoxylase-like metal-dependent hydrolase (beta-lactamase superfamily II)
MVFDTGLHGVAAKVCANLKKCGVSPEEIDLVFISHLHFDHVNNLQLYPRARVIVGRTEWEAAFANKDPYTPIESLYYIRDYREKWLVEDGQEILPGIVTLLTPGHSAGHCSLLLEMEGEKVILAGDAAKNRVELREERSDLYMDEKASTDSILKIKASAARVLPGHDGWLEIVDGKVSPLEEKFLTIRLPAGFGPPGTLEHTISTKVN